MANFIFRNHGKVFFTFLVFLVCLMCGDFIVPLGYMLYIHYWRLQPILQVPELYNVRHIERSWQMNFLKIEKLEVEVVYSELSLFNWQSLVQYTITGSLLSDGISLPVLGNVHVSQSYFLDDRNGSTFPCSSSLVKDRVEKEVIAEAAIELLPLVTSLRARNKDERDANFSITNQIVVQSMHMGENIVRFQCGDFWKHVHLFQRK